MPRQMMLGVSTKRWSKDEARSMLEALDQSQQSVSAFARAHGVSPQRLYRWRQLLREEAVRCRRTSHASRVAIAPSPHMAGLQLAQSRARFSTKRRRRAIACSALRR